MNKLINSFGNWNIDPPKEFNPNGTKSLADFEDVSIKKNVECV